MQPENYTLPRIDATRVLYRYWIRDHAAVRAIIPNAYRVDAQLFRSSHPGPRLLARLKARGLASVLSLRGDPDSLPNMIERAACSRLGLPIRFVPLRTAILPEAESLLDLVGALRAAPKPMLLHCKSGADRTGFATTLYLHVVRGEPLERARRALNWRFGHFRFGDAGVIHALLDAYAADHARTGIAFEDWVRTRYDRDALQPAVARRSWGGRE